MLDAGAAVRAAVGGQVRIDVSPAAPVAGSSVTFSGAGSVVAPGRTVAGWAWTLVDGGGVASAFSSGSDAPMVTLSASSAGRVAVRLVVTDDRGVAIASQTSVAVAAAPVPPASSSGGGSLSWTWLAGLALAAGALGRKPARARGPSTATHNPAP